MNTSLRPFRPAARHLLALATGLGLALLSLTALAQPSPANPAGLPTAADVPRLIAVLKQADATVAAKARACQQLALVGGAEAVPALAALLADPTLSHYARTGLEAIPEAAATAALREALPSLPGNLRVGVVNSLGVRRDALAVPALVRLAADPSQGAAPEALIALARIATPESIAAVRKNLGVGPAELRAAAAEGLLLAAERESAQGRLEAAAALYDAVRATEVPAPLRLAALRGAILSRKAAGAPLLVEQLRSEDPERRGIAVRAARELADPAVDQALANELPRCRPEVQVLVLRALADRGNRAIRGPVEALAKAEAAEVRLASLEALGVVGEASSVPILLAAVARTDASADAEVATASLIRLEAGNPDQSILAALTGSPAATRARLISILGYRQATAATPKLIELAGDPDAGVARAAFEALAAVATPADLPAVIKAALAAREAAVREKAEGTLYAIAVKQPDPARRSDTLAAAYRQGPDAEGKGLLLQVMAMLGDATAQQTVATAYDDPSASVRDAALRLLVHWPDATPTPQLLRIFKTTAHDVHRSLALEGIVGLASLWTDPANRPPGAAARPPKDSIAWLTEANAAIKRDNAAEKRTLISGLGDLNCEEGLALLRPYLDDETVRKEASLAVLRAVKGLTTPAEKAAARPLLEKIVASGPEADVKKQAEEALRKLGGS